MSKILGANIRKFRVALGYKQIVLAYALGLTEQQVSLYEVGKGNPRYTNLLRLADILQVSAEDLVRGDSWQAQCDEGGVNFKGKKI